MDRAKALEKIQKCLALGKSPNEHEASAAMRQAQALMRNFGISERELGTLGFASETVQTAIQAGKKIPITLSNIVALIKHAFGVSPVYGRAVLKTDSNFKVTYFGREDRVLLAGYAHVVVARAVEQSWQKHLKENPRAKGVVGARAGFYAGWINAVYETVDKFANTEEDIKGAELLIEQTYTKTLIGEGGKELVVNPLRSASMSNHNVSGSTMRAGASAADGFSLHRPINAERRKITA